MTFTEMEEGRTFPDVDRIREVSQAVAVAVINEALKHDLTTKIGMKNAIIYL
jgi:malic enzyme